MWWNRNPNWATNNDYLNSIVRSGNFTGRERVLCLGCGPGVVARVLEPNVRLVVELDFNLSVLSKSRGGICVNAFAVDLPFADQVFDTVIARMIFHELVDTYETVMAECRRVLVPGGRMILSEGIVPHPGLKDWFSEMFAYKERRITFSDDDLVLFLESGGFKCVSKTRTILPRMSIVEWLDSSGVDSCNKEKILDMHRTLDNWGKKQYNMIVTDNDIYCDFHFMTLTGVKKRNVFLVFVIGLLGNFHEILLYCI